MKSLTALIKEEGYEERQTKKNKLDEVIQAPLPVRRAISKIVNLKRKIAELYREYDQYEQQILEFADQKIIDYYKQGKQSIKIAGLKNDQVQVVYTSRFSFPKDINKVKQVLGRYYKEMVQENVEIRLRPEVLEDEKLQAELIKKLGKDLSKFFVKRTTLKPTKSFLPLLTTMTEEKRNKVLGIIRQAKPSVRLS